MKILTRRSDSPKAGAKGKIRLLIADDHALILEGLAATIAGQDEMAVVAQAEASLPNECNG
ncbi:MAG: hypothetical protein H0W04_02345 [Chthoniobacterales bacterium]|nr:hypothetical protein [Chthoniobacterales bacterium]